MSCLVSLHLRIVPTLPACVAEGRGSLVMAPLNSLFLITDRAAADESLLPSIVREDDGLVGLGFLGLLLHFKI